MQIYIFQPTDNTYATIQGGGRERFGDYATLGRDSPTPLEAALGFQVKFIKLKVFLCVLIYH